MEVPRFTVSFILLVILNFSICKAENNENFKRDTLGRPNFKWPTVGVSILIRNKAHTLPYFFTSLYNVDYPKDRMYIWIYSDFNEDNSIEIINEWIGKFGFEYNWVNVTINNSTGRLHPDETTSTHWSPKRFDHVIKLREEGLNLARKKWADYIFMLDADVFLVENQTLKNLVSKNLTVVAPMLLSDGLYSNFWCGMTENYYYERTDDYKPILEMKNPGCHDVPMVHSAVLINLRHLQSDKLTYDPAKIKDYVGPQDDIIAFAVNAKNKAISLNICNDKLYGFVPIPLEENDNLSKDHHQLINIKLEAIGRGTPLVVNDYLMHHITYPIRTKYGCNEMYMINLERRSERRELMVQSFKELGMDALIFRAIDGRDLGNNFLMENFITLMPKYEDPYYKRPMKFGEIGCFLSHYRIWQEVVEKRHAIALVLEDDIHFVPYFRNKFFTLLEEIKSLDWDLIYIGRKILMDSEEQYVTEHVVKPVYSYWTLGYLINYKGAKKLIDAEPLSKLLPVDEYLPIMFDQHPNDTWKSYFSKRNLKAYSASPLLVHPTHYTGQEGYVSDTEDSSVLNNPRAVKTEL